MSAHGLNLFGVLSETKRIINAHSRHFLALSVLFLLPLSFSNIVYPSVVQSPSFISHYHRSLSFSISSDPEIPPINGSVLLLNIIYAFFVFLFSICATASITHSTFHGFYGRPVKLIASIKSIIFSFFHLVATSVLSLIIMLFIIVAFGGFTALVYYGFVLFGVHIDYNNLYFMGFVILIIALAVGFLMYLLVEWSLSNVVVIVESKWGYEALKRSSYLLKGMKGLAFAMIMLFAVLLGFLGMLCSTMVPKAGGLSGGGWVNCAFIFQTVVYTGFMTILMLYGVAATAVLFMYCKAMQGELAFEIAEEFAQEYIRLPYDDGKVPHVVYVV